MIPKLAIVYKYTLSPDAEKILSNLVEANPKLPIPIPNKKFPPFFYQRNHKWPKIINSCI